MSRCLVKSLHMASKRGEDRSEGAVVDVRRAVLDGALDIIATEGPEAVSMREVARRAGVSHQAPYHYFGDRAGIFAAISEEGFRNFTNEFRAALDLPGDIASNCLRAYVSCFVDGEPREVLAPAAAPPQAKSCPRFAAGHGSSLQHC